MNTIKTYIKDNKDRFISELIELLKIPSISADSAYKNDLVKTANAVKSALEMAGCKVVEICETPGNPIVYGEHIIDKKLPTVLVYGNRAEDRITYRDELEVLSRDHGTKVIHLLSEPPLGWTGHTGIMDAQLIAELFQFPEMKDWLYLLCGPVKMMVTVEDKLIAMGVPSNQVLSERFNYD